ncbi:MAG: aldo/keto reductase [Nitrospirae bacterium]|nr:aldo/keto reductase [Nitrospirota bacterium]MDA1304357.1 aldo/keto reductase [Nitrospirota bacterium]
MKQRQLGTSELTVSALGLGCMSMSEFYGQANQQEALATLHLAIERGLNFFDTADIYGQGRNEEFVGAALKEHRSKIILATKFGIVRNDHGEFVGVNSRPDYVRSACEASLKRLGVEVIDLYYQHRVDPDTPIEDTVGAMADLVHAGKVRYLGLSEASAQTLRKAHAVHPIAALQSEYSLWTRDPEEEILPTCRELGIGFVPYSPLGRGFLAHNIAKPEDLDDKDSRRKNPRFRPENFQKNLQLVEAIEGLANKKRCTPAQLALAWVLTQGKDIIPIPGTTKRTHLESNITALDICLSPEDLTHINHIAPLGVAAGDRYPEVGMTWVNL